MRPGSAYAVQYAGGTQQSCQQKLFAASKIESFYMPPGKDRWRSPVPMYLFIIAPYQIRYRTWEWQSPSTFTTNPTISTDEIGVVI